MDNQHPDNLEKIIHQTLRSLPNHRAPDTLMLRVQAAIAAREARPWWQKGFHAWPHSARTIFFVLSSVAMAAVLFAGSKLVAGADVGDIFAQLNIFHGVLNQASALGDSVQLVYNAIPPLWLYGSLGVIAAMYVTLAGLSAAFYRTFLSVRR
ncbi:MAG TPA: hypothetical protein VKC60_15090 [Opitutaceae bacterium]|nr:hypothetical protein [Opitutaceae bacterium]